MAAFIVFCACVLVLSSAHPLDSLKKMGAAEVEAGWPCQPKGTFCNSRCCPADTRCCWLHSLCCPEDTNCGDNGTCLKIKHDHMSVKYEKDSVNKEDNHSITCPSNSNGTKTQCAEGSLCCLVNSNSAYGCCPRANGVCCGDGRCCDKTYMCGQGFGSLCSPLVPGQI